MKRTSLLICGCNLDEKIEGLQNEVKHANELLEMARRRGVAPLTEAEVEALSPSAAAASRLLKSGMTLTQVIEAFRLK